jgi:hypothetical protein
MSEDIIYPAYGREGWTRSFLQRGLPVVDSSELGNYHNRFSGSCSWKLIRSGVNILDSGVERTSGKPATITRLWDKFGYEICAASMCYGVPVELILATIATESSGRECSCREEPGYVSDKETPHRVSAGLMQTLISTARGALRGEVKPSVITREWLYTPLNSIRAGARYIRQMGDRTEFDPPLVAAGYNAGGVYYQSGENNRWKLRQYPIGTGKHVDRFIRFYNDAVSVIGLSDKNAPWSHADLVSGEPIIPVWV